MSQATTNTITLPKVHPLLNGATYGLAAAVIQYIVVVINRSAFSSPNGLLGFAGGVLVPLVATFLAGHYAGRHERLHGKTELSNVQSTLFGTGSGLTAGVVFVVLTQIFSSFISPWLKTVLTSFHPDTNSFGALGSVLGGIGLILGIIGWLFVGLVLGTFGGIFGDSRATKQLKSGVQVVEKK